MTFEAKPCGGTATLAGGMVLERKGPCKTRPLRGNPQAWSASRRAAAGSAAVNAKPVQPFSCCLPARLWRSSMQSAWASDSNFFMLKLGKTRVRSICQATVSSSEGAVSLSVSPQKPTWL